MSEQNLCACGKPLHYSDPIIQQMMQELVDQRGEDIHITVRGRTWLVQRHYIALHGVKAQELERLGFPEVTDGAV